MLPNPWVILGFVGFLLLSVGGASWLAYHRGADDTLAAVTKQELTKANKALTDSSKRQGDGQQAAKEHDDHEQAILDAFRHIRTGPAAVAIRPDTDPFVPVWAVRLFDRSASGNPSGDPYPGKSDADASDVKLSEAIAMLSINFEGCQVNRSRLIDIIHLEPVLPALPPPTIEKPSLLDRINPF